MTRLGRALAFVPRGARRANQDSSQEVQCGRRKEDRLRWLRRQDWVWPQLYAKLRVARGHRQCRASAPPKRPPCMLVLTSLSFSPPLLRWF